MISGRDPGSTVLVTGGAGFIGSHTCVELLENGHRVVVIDDHSNSTPASLERVAKLTGRAVTAYTGDVRDRALLDRVFEAQRIDQVIHFAARKAVGESVEFPLEYWDVNVGATVALLQAMRDHGVRDLVFSSSCSVYGVARRVPLTEEDPVAPVNPYARTKSACEQILADACRRHPEFRILALRYFNPAGAHPSGLLGEDPRGVPNNLMPYLTQVAIGRLDRLPVHGTDYPTPDGSCIRDYIHVVDVADGHRVALDHLADETGVRVRNLGTGVGTSVLEVVSAFESATGRPIPVTTVGRRPGDVPVLVADPSRVAREWGWRTTRDVADMCADAWRFQQLNPFGHAC
ncbi:UDP-glucose 4-epimerase GalE [Blastococcus deserti]|uniref:UDP-glucose 4-epimerase n=1 Tax=Blastococcus deserti TaxID=2259033 RepID=A0ABW4XGK6_9ACTN